MRRPLLLFGTLAAASSLFALPLSGCASDAIPRLDTPADSLAARIADASGGMAAWHSLPTLRFDWAAVRDSVEGTRVRHLWDKDGDRTRIEWSVGEDSILVAVIAPSAFDPEAPEGIVAINGRVLGGAERAERLVDAHRRHINDTYWLLAPLKALDPGVRRELAPDSGQGVLAMSFDGVGLTPGDRYWLRSDPSSGLITGWTFLLEGDSTAARWAWTEPAEIPTPRGPLRLPVAKIRDGGGRSIRTEPLPVPAPDESLFTDPAPRLVSGSLLPR